jgi:hypothetical protein
MSSDNARNEMPYSSNVTSSTCPWRFSQLNVALRPRITCVSSRSNTSPSAEITLDAKSTRTERATTTTGAGAIPSAALCTISAVTGLSAPVNTNAVPLGSDTSASA